MAYQKRNFKKDQLLTDDDLNAMDDQIASNEESAKKANDDIKNKLDKSAVVQEKGNSETAVMSQAAATKEFGKLSEEIAAEEAARHDAIAQERNRAVSRENGIEELFTMPTQEAVGKWLDEHPEATTTVRDKSLTAEKFTDDLKLHTIKDYVTPQMFGAKGDGVTDDTTSFSYAILYCRKNNKTLFIPKSSYCISNQLNISNVRIIGDYPTLDFDNNTDENCIISDGNSTHIERIEITNGSKISGYGIRLNYFANNAKMDHVKVTNCANGIFISSSWYADIKDVYINIGESGKCFVFGEDNRSNEINGIALKNINLTGGEYGIYIEEGVMFGSVTFSGVTVERQSTNGIYCGSGSRGNVSFMGLYFENTALNGTDGCLVLNKGNMVISLECVLTRGEYTNTPKLFVGNIVFGVTNYFAATNCNHSIPEKFITNKTKELRSTFDEELTGRYSGQYYLEFSKEDPITIKLNAPNLTQGLDHNNIIVKLKVIFENEGDTYQTGAFDLTVFLYRGNSSVKEQITSQLLYTGYYVETKWSIERSYEGYGMTIKLINGSSNYYSVNKYCFVEVYTQDKLGVEIE